MTLTSERKQLYTRLQNSIGHTPLSKIRHIKIPKGNTIFFKEEYRNPTGSHYDREFVRLLKSLEEKELIVPTKSVLVETTTGNAGASFAWLCRILGYKCKVIIPEDVPCARRAQIKSFGAEVILAPPEQYVKGIIQTLRVELKGKQGIEYCTNHAADQEYCIAAMQDLGEEIIDDLRKVNVQKVDYFICALGNGSSLRGVGKILKERFETEIVGVEPYEAPDIYVKKFGKDKFCQVYGCQPSFGPHELLGTGAWGTDFEFPNTVHMMQYIQDIVLVNRAEWKERVRELADKEFQHVGRTSGACLHVALKVAEKVQNKIFLLIFYDAAWKYLDLQVDKT